MNRRSFIKALGVLAATPALGKYLNVFKSAPVREGIAQGKSMGMDFFNSVIKKVMDEGSQVGEADRIATFKHPDRADILVEVDKASGDTTVLFEADSGTKSMMQKVNTMDESTKGKTVSDIFEAEEVYGPMGREEQEGITGGITNLEEFINKKKFAMGGRVELARGGLPRALQAALKAIKSKFGDDAIKTVTEEQTYGLPFANIPTPEKSIIRNKMQNFGKPGKFDEDGNIDYDYYADILDDSENTVVYGDETIEELEALLKERTDEYAEMKGMYDRGELDKYAPSKFDNVNDNQIAAAVDDIFPSGDYKLDAEMAAEALVENNPQIFGDMLYDDLDDITRSKIYSSVLEVLSGKNAKMLQMKRNLSKPTATLASMKAGKGINISDPNILDEFTTFMKESDPKGYTDLEQKVELSNFNPKGKKGNADGGIIGLTTKPRPAKSKAGVEKLIERR